MHQQALSSILSSEGWGICGEGNLRCRRALSMACWYEQLPFLVMGRSQRKPSSLFVVVLTNPFLTMFSLLGADSGSAMNSSLTAYGTEYTSTRDTYLAAAKALKEATGPYKATRDAYVAATATYTKSLYE